jgi:hypothetical protein
MTITAGPINDSTYIQALTALGLFDKIQQATLSKEGAEKLRVLITETYQKFIIALKPVQDMLVTEIQEVIEKDKAAFEAALANGTAAEKLKYAQVASNLTDKQVALLRLIVNAVLEEKGEADERE